MTVKMENFNRRRGDIVKEGESEFEPIIKEWAELIFGHSQKGLAPLFITGSGVSKGAGVPDIIGIIQDLERKSTDGNGDYKKEIPQYVIKLFNTWEELNNKKKKDRSIVARLLNAFQKKDVSEDVKKIWKDMNKDLLGKIQNANPTLFHKKLAELYLDERFSAVCLTLNFDGLLIKELVKKQNERAKNERAFSLPTKKECENFFLRLKKEIDRAFIEVQVRGDILYLECNAKDYCPQKGNEPQPLWTSFTMQNISKGKLIKCPSCGEDRVSYLSFPGSYDKEKDMRGILEVVWRYLAFRISSVTIVGMSGEWDPLIVAFLGDLLSEREIPLLIVDALADKKKTFVIRELVVPTKNGENTKNPALALNTYADTFMEKLSEGLKDLQPDKDDNNRFDYAHPFDDHFWYNFADNDSELKEKINTRVSEIEIKLEKQIKGLEKSAQLGLKSIWLGIDPTKEPGKYHDRYNHSLGVMKVASYIYNEAIENSKNFRLKPNQKEKQFLRIAALLHDIGHLPFSHLIEEVFNELNWKPAGYISSFSHILHTEEKVKEIFKEDSLSKEMEKLGYEIPDLVRLINGNFGVGYLDAIINSPIDADKIDYVFCDTDSTERKISLSPTQFLKDIVNGLTITPEKLLAFSGVSAKAVGELLYARRHLYQNLYLQPGIRILEGIVKQIIITYFVHTLNLDDMEIAKRDSPDLGHYKILYCIRKIEELRKRISDNGSKDILEKHLPEDDIKKYENNIELPVLTLMYDELNKLPLNEKLKESLNIGFKKVINTKSEDALKKLESDIKYLPFDNDDYYDKVVKAAKTCKLRMPGALIIEVVKTPKFLSISDERKKKKRSDDTETFSECILVPSGKYETWYPTQDAQQPLLSSSLRKEEEKKGFSVYIYPFSEDKSDVIHAENLFEKLREQENSPMETD